MAIFNHQFIGRKKWEVVEKDTIDINCSSITFYDPIGLSFLAGLLDFQSQVSDSIVIHFSPEVLNYLERIDFFRFLDETFSIQITIKPERPRIRRRELKGSLLEFHRIEFSDKYQMRDIIQELAQITFERSKGAIPSEFVNDVFAELLDNIRRHSGKDYFFTVAQSYQNTVKISIADIGIGIPRKIKSQFTEVQTDSNAIIYSTEPGVSTYVEGGWGLTILRDYLEFSGEYLFIASNNGCVKFINTRPYVYPNYGCGFSGTFVEICFRTDVTRTPEIEENFLPF